MFACNASYSEKRNKVYLLSDPFYTTSLYYFYSNKNHLNGLDIKSIADNKIYNLCGVFVYNYENYWIPKDSKLIDIGSKNMNQLIGKTLLWRCDLFAEQKEIIQGLFAINDIKDEKNELKSKEIPNRKKTNFHYMISRS